MNKAAKCTALIAVFAATFWIGESRPARATQSCDVLYGTPCSPPFSHTTCVSDGMEFECTCMQDKPNPDPPTWVCPF